MPEEQVASPQGGEPLTQGPAPADPQAAAAEGKPAPDPMAQTGQASGPPAMKNKTVPIEEAIQKQKERKKQANKYNNAFNDSLP